METKDIVTVSVGVLSVCVAIFAATVAHAAILHQRRSDKWSVNHDLLVRAWSVLETNPELVRLHGIDPKELSDDGITFKEFYYVYLHMNAGSAYYRVGGDPAVLTPFRQNFLGNAQVQKIWKRYLRGRLFNPTDFSDAVDTFIAEHPASEPPITVGGQKHVA